MKSTTAYDDQFAPEPIQEIEQEHHDKIVGIIAEKIEAERRPAPHGWKLVPVEPTPEMLAAGKHTIKGADTTFEGMLAELAYRSMLAAAPTPPAQAEPSDEHLIETGCYQTVIDRHSQPTASAEPVKITCKKCNGTGVESTRFHGVWPNGEECLEPIKCDQCGGFGTTSAAAPAKDGGGA